MWEVIESDIENIEKRIMAMALLFQSIPEALMADFDRLKMKDTESIDDFVGKLSEILSKSAALGEEIE